MSGLVMAKRGVKSEISEYLKHDRFTYASYGDSSGDWRGLILPSAASVDDQYEYLTEIDVTPQELRGYAFLWDRFVYPVEERYPPSRTFGELDILDRFTLHDGKLRYRNDLFAHAGGDPAIRALASQYQLFKLLEAKDAGRWAVAESSLLPLEIPAFGRSLMVRLCRAIPVPSNAVTFDDIVDFRERRRSELSSFRYHLEELYQKIEGNPDPSCSFVSEFEHLKISISDILRTMNERKFEVRMGSLQAKIKWEPGLPKFNFDPTIIVAGAGIGAYFDALQNALTISVIAASAQNFFPKIEIEGAAGVVDGRSKGPLQYVLLMHEEFRRQKSRRHWPFKNMVS